MLSVERERINAVSRADPSGLKLEGRRNPVSYSPPEVFVHPPSLDPYSHVSLILILLGRSCLDRRVSLRILVTVECVHCLGTGSRCHSTCGSGTDFHIEIEDAETQLF